MKDVSIGTLIYYKLVTELACWNFVPVSIQNNRCNYMGKWVNGEGHRAPPCTFVDLHCHYACMYGAHKRTISVVIFFSFVRNNISFVRNIISFVRNNISFERNIISLFRLYEILFRLYEILFRLYEILFRLYEIIFRLYEILFRLHEILFRLYEIICTKWPGSVTHWQGVDHWGREAWIQTHLLGYIAMLGLYILSGEIQRYCYVP